MTAPADPEISATDEDSAGAPVRRRSSLPTMIAGIVVVIGVLAVGVVSTRNFAPPPVAGSGTNAPRLGEEGPADRAFALPPATLEGFAGGPDVDLTTFRGKPMIINFWATWCAPCVKEMPDFQAAAAEFGDRVTFLGVDVEDAPPNAEPFVEQLGIDYPLAIDPRREFYQAVGNVGMPTTLLVDPDGIVRYRHTGPLDRKQLKSLVREHLDTRV